MTLTLVSQLENVINSILTQYNNLLDQIQSIFNLIGSSVSSLITYFNSNSGVFSMISSTYNAIPLIIRTTLIVAILFIVIFQTLRRIL